VTSETRSERLAAELEAMQALQAASSILGFESTGSPPDRYTLTFRGRGVCRSLSSTQAIEYLDQHRVEIRLPYAYPQRPPDIRWLTAVFHPNISFSGLIKLKDVGLPWDRDLGLDVICERLWDVARLAFLDLERATNFSAKKWFTERRTIALPTDPRPLRDKVPPSGVNIVRYERTADGRIGFPEAQQSEEILFIGEDTPTPDLPIRVRPRRRTPRGDDDEILYIGDD
jgi:ubiquitin-protein ligase